MPRPKSSRRTPFNPWTLADIARLRRLAGRMPGSAIAKRLARSEAAVVFKAHTLRLPLSTRGRRAVNATAKRSPTAKGKKPAPRATAKNYWTAAQIQLVRRLAGTLPRPDIAERIGRTDSALAYKAHELGISLAQQRPGVARSAPPARAARARRSARARRTPPSAWTAADLRFLSQNAGTLSREQLARRLNRSPAAVTFKAFKERISLRRR